MMLLFYLAGIMSTMFKIVGTWNMLIHSIVVEGFHAKPYTWSPWCERKCLGITKAIRIHPLRTMNVCTNIHGHHYNYYWDISSKDKQKKQHWHPLKKRRLSQTKVTFLIQTYLKHDFVHILLFLQLRRCGPIAKSWPPLTTLRDNLRWTCELGSVR